MAANSQYLAAYLAENRSRGEGKGLTVGSYLHGRLKGRAKSYAGRYCIALANSCERAGAVKGRSCRAGVAYYPKDENETN